MQRAQKTCPQIVMVQSTAVSWQMVQKVSAAILSQSSLKIHIVQSG
jgi:hypothetical protein